MNTTQATEEYNEARCETIALKSRRKYNNSTMKILIDEVPVPESVKKVEEFKIKSKIGKRLHKAGCIDQKPVVPLPDKESVVEYVRTKKEMGKMEASHVLLRALRVQEKAIDKLSVPGAFSS